MGSSEEIYWNMAKNNRKLERENAIMPSCDGNYLINNTLYMSASSLCSHNMPSCSHIIFMCSYLYLIVCQKDKLFIVVSVTYF